MSKQDGGPAFPVECAWDDNGITHGLQTGNRSGWHVGLSLRDYFAAKALPCAWDAFDKGYWTCDAEDINRTIAGGAYQLADAMLAARDK